MLVANAGGSEAVPDSTLIGGPHDGVKAPDRYVEDAEGFTAEVQVVEYQTGDGPWARYEVDEDGRWLFTGYYDESIVPEDGEGPET